MLETPTCESVTRCSGVSSCRSRAALRGNRLSVPRSDEVSVPDMSFVTVKICGKALRGCEVRCVEEVLSHAAATVAADACRSGGNVAGTDHHRHELERLLAISIGPACHELRSPLAVVYGFARMVQQADKSDAAHVQHIVDGGSRLDDLLDILAVMGRIASGRTHPESADHALDAILAELVVESADTLPLSVAGSCEQLVHVDRSWLASAISDAVRGLCYEPSMRVQAAPRPHSGGVRIDLTVDSTMPLPERDEGNCNLRVALARMRVVAMGGAVHAADFGLTIDVPSRGAYSKS